MNTVSIELLLEELGPSPSSKIKARLMSAGLSDEAARQRISRTNGVVRRFLKINLPKNEKFLYLDKQYGTEEFWRCLLDAHVGSNSAYGIAINSIINRGGIITERSFGIISGSPIRLKKHLSSNSILNNLISCGFLKRESVEGIGNCVLIDAQGILFTPSINNFKSKLIVEEIIVKAVYDWSKKIGLASHNAIKKRENDKILPDFGNFQFDITAPSYVLPLAHFNENNLNPGFIVIDVTSSELDIGGVMYFIQKCKTIRSLINMPPFLSILLADRFNDEAFRQRGSAGVIFTTPAILFGEEIANSIRELRITLENAATMAVEKPERIHAIFSSLSRIEGAAINLRGALFELIVGHLVNAGEGGNIDIGKKVKNRENESAEIDIILNISKHTVIIYECKGYQPTTNISLEEVSKWVEKRIPIIYSWLKEQSNYPDAKISFEYWTTGNFSDEAINFLEKTKTETKKYKINWKNGNDVLDYANEKKCTSMANTLKEHYLRHPLAE